MLAFSATLNNDKVGLLLYTDEVEHYLPPKKVVVTSFALFEIFYLSLWVAARSRVALNYLNRVQKRKAVVFLVSDFQESDAQTFTTLALTNQRHDLISISAKRSA